MIIREARPDEYPAIGELRVTAYRALGLLPEGSEYIDTLRGFGFGTDCAVLVATDETGSGLLGTIAIEWFDPSSELARDETEADVRAFAVAPQGQGQGVGRSLLQAVIERADKRGLRRLRLCTNPVMQAAQHLYETTGFSRTPDLDWSPARPPGSSCGPTSSRCPSSRDPGTAREELRAVHSIPATFIEFNGAQLPEPPVTQTPPYQVTDPATGEVVQTFPFATDAEVEQALAAATAAFAQWRKRPVAERAEIVARVGQLFTERSAELAAIITKEMGKRPAQAVGEAEFCTDIFGYYAENGPGLLADRPLPGHDAARVEYLPVGPVLGVMPWNYPYYQIARFAAPNLIVGNTIILKHAENCPTSALAVAQIMKDAGLPEGVYNNIFATHEQVATMIADPRLRGVSLTGSERAGTVVAETAGRNLKKVVLELGGSDPYIILDAVDVNAAAKTAWITRMENVGQACNSNKRMIVMDSVYDDFVAALVKRATGMTPAAGRRRLGHCLQPDGVPQGGREPARAGQGRGREGRDPARGRHARRRRRRLLRPGRAHRGHPGHAGLQGGAVRPGRGGLQGHRR